MGAFSEIAVCVFSVLLLQDVASGYYQDSCTTKTKLGTFRDVTIFPAVKSLEELAQGDELDVTVRVTTPFKAKATWTLAKMVENPDEYYNNAYSIPVAEKETGSTRAKTESEGSDRYSFSLHLDSFDHEHIFFSLQLDHPCNAITIYGDLDLWLNMTGGALPTALSVPRPFIDLSAKTAAQMKVGMEVDYDMAIGSSRSYFHLVRKNGMMYINRGGSHDPISIGTLAGPGGAQPRAPGYGRSVSAVIVLRKRPEKLGDIEAMTLRTKANLLFSGQHPWQDGLTISATTQVKLIDHESRAAIMMLSNQFHSRMLVPRDRNGSDIGFYDSDGTRLIPFILDDNMKVPFVFHCFAGVGEGTPYIAVALTHINPHGIGDGMVLDSLASAESPGWMHSIFEVPSQDDKTSDFIFSVADGEVVTNMPFRTIITKAVKTTTDIEDAVPLDEETFTKGFAFSCQASGDPIPAIKFYKEDKYSVGYSPNAMAVNEANYIGEIKDSDRFSVASSDGQATLTVSPGSSPYPGDDEAFRLVCVGANQFTLHAAYVDFIAPKFNMTRYY